VELDLRERDMRDLALDDPAALAYCPFRALLTCRSGPTAARTFERVAVSLRAEGSPGTPFAFEHRLAACFDGEHQEEPVPRVIRYSVGDNRIDIALDDGATSSVLVGNAERGWSRVGGALRWLRPRAVCGRQPGRRARCPPSVLD